MLTKRIIPCLDVKNGQVVKGIQFRNHRVVGGIVELAKLYTESGADELVFYDITASSDGRGVDTSWITKIAKVINIPFCVAGGIRSSALAKEVLYAGADKVSINSPAIENPELINQLVKEFGQQCIVVGIDSYQENNQYKVKQYTGDTTKTITTDLETAQWIFEIQQRGAGEIVLNCMNNDGVRKGYDLEQLSVMRRICNIPLIASGGAGNMQDFLEVFKTCNVDGALAASVFHNNQIKISDLKTYLQSNSVEVRI